MSIYSPAPAPRTLPAAFGAPLTGASVDVPPPAPDVVPLPPSPHPVPPPPAQPPEIVEPPPEIIEPPLPGGNEPVREPGVGNPARFAQ